MVKRGKQLANVRGLLKKGADADIALQMPSTTTRLEEVMLVIANYPPCNVYNMEVVLSLLAIGVTFFQTKRETECEVKDKNLLTIYFSTSATVVKVRLSIIGTSQRPRCFRRNAVLSSATCFSQNNACSDDVMCRQWLDTVFLEHVRAVTTSPMLLLMDNHFSAKSIRWVNSCGKSTP